MRIKKIFRAIKQKACLITEEGKLAGRKSEWVVGDGVPCTC